MTLRIMPRAATLAALGAGLILLTGCAATTSSAPQSKNGVTQQVLDGSSKQVRAALADGHVTRDEYDAAYRSFTVCMKAGGSPLMESPMVEDTYQFSYLASAAALYKKCYNKDFYAVDMVWQIAHPTVETRLQTCLVLAGDQFVGTVDEMKAQLVKDGKDPDKCLAKTP